MSCGGVGVGVKSDASTDELHSDAEGVGVGVDLSRQKASADEKLREEALLAGLLFDAAFSLLAPATGAREMESAGERCLGRRKRKRCDALSCAAAPDTVACVRASVAAEPSSGEAMVLGEALVGERDMLGKYERPDE